MVNTLGLTSLKYNEFGHKSPSDYRPDSGRKNTGIQFAFKHPDSACRNTWGIMKIQVSMPDSQGTYAGQSIEAEENAQILFASFLPVAGLAESKPSSEKTLNIGIDCMNDGMNRVVVNLSAGLEQNGLQGDESLIDITAANISAPGMADDVLNTLPVPINESNHRLETTLKEMEPAVPQATVNLVPNVLEQINTASSGVENVQKSPSSMYHAEIMTVDKSSLKKTDVMMTESELPEPPLEFEVKDKGSDRILEQVSAPVMDLANKQTRFAEVFSGQIQAVTDENDQELIAHDSTLALVNETDSVKTIANLAEHHSLPNSHSFDTLLTNVANFLNKRLDTAVASSQNKSGDAISLSAGVYRELENNPALKAFQYSSNDLPASLKIDSYFATLKVYPPDLGQVTAEIQINKGMTELTLRVDNPQVRHFIETSLPQLRESFENSYINLGEVNIQNNSSDSRHDFQNNQQPFFGNVSVQQKQDDARAGTQARKQSNLIIDTYA